MSDNTYEPLPAPQKFVLEIEYSGFTNDLVRLLGLAMAEVVLNGPGRIQVRDHNGHRVGVGRLIDEYTLTTEQKLKRAKELARLLLENEEGEDVG